MRTLLIAFLLGTVAVGLVAYGVATAVVMLALAEGWSSFRVAVGPLVLVDVERTARGDDVSTFGPALAVVAVLGGAVNAAGAPLLRRRQERSGSRG